MAEITPIRTAAETGLVEHFASAKHRLPGDPGLRDAAFARFTERGLPHRRVEEWKYTDLRNLMRTAAPLAAPPDEGFLAEALQDSGRFGDVEASRVTFVNGFLARDRSDLGRLPSGLDIVPLTDALSSGHLRFVSAGEGPFATATRVLLVLEEGASLTLLETHEGRDGTVYQANDVVEVVASDKASLNHVRFNGESRQALALSTVTAKLGTGVSFRSLNVVTGAEVSRHQVFLTFAGQNSTVSINGANMLKGRQHADTTLLVDHATPHCDSRELFKTVVDDDATGVFQGKIIVRPDAQKVDGRMMSGCLLLSDGGTMYNKPELEIFADDVQCAHGATCGQLDENLLFYLKSRGLPQAEAERLLVQAFVGEAVETVGIETLHDILVEIVEDWLRARG
jgi:Fe-S cluster assembly protein SufD